MKLFPLVTTDKLIFVGEKTRIDCSRSFVIGNEGEEIVVSVKPSPDDSFIPTNTDKHLDWVFDEPGEVTLQVKLEIGAETKTIDHIIVVKDVALLKLFSDDSDLIPFEPDIRGYIPPQSSTFNLVHARAQDLILNILDEARIYGKDGERLTADKIADVLEVRDWSTALTLQLIFEGMSNQVGDIYSLKADKYKGMAGERGNRASIRLDISEDETVTQKDIYTGTMVRS